MMTWVLLPGPSQEVWQEYSVLLTSCPAPSPPHRCSSTIVEAPQPELRLREEEEQGRGGRRGREEWGEMV